MTNAFHSSSAPDGSLRRRAGRVRRRRQTTPGSTSPGDTSVFGDMQLIARLYAPTVAVLPIGDHFTMGPKEAALALELLGNPRCVPCHWGTFPLLTGTPAALVALTSATVEAIAAGRHGGAVRERWFGATGRRVPEIALEGELELGDALVLDAIDDGRAARRARRGPAGRGPRRERRRGEGGARAARGGGGARHRPRTARPRSDRAHLWLSRSSRPTRSPPATSPRVSGASRPSRSSSPSARSSRGPSPASARWRRRRTQTRATAPTGWRSCATAPRPRRRSRRLTAADDGRATRQLGVVDAHGGSATYTGAGCMTWAGGRTGPCFAAQGNILVGEETVAALADTFARDRRAAARATADRVPRRRAGGRRRPARASSRQRSWSSSATAAMPGSATCSSTCASTTTSSRSRSSPASTRSRTCCSARRRATSGSSVDATLAAELSERLAQLGYDGPLEEALAAWAGTENLEERVDGVEQIDPVVLRELRAR